MAPAVRACAVRRDRPLRAHPPALFPLQSARVHHGLPAGAVSRRGGGALGAALRAARLARPGGAAADLAHRRSVRSAVDPIRENAAVAPATRELTFLLADPARRPLRALAARLPAVATPDHRTRLAALGALGLRAASAPSCLRALWVCGAGARMGRPWRGVRLVGA